MLAVASVLFRRPPRHRRHPSMLSSETIDVAYPQKPPGGRFPSGSIRRVDRRNGVDKPGPAGLVHPRVRPSRAPKGGPPPPPCPSPFTPSATEETSCGFPLSAPATSA